MSRQRQPQPWEERWTREGGSLGGGQGESFIARSKADDGLRVFVKTLRRDRLGDSRARGRFHREVGIYETLDGLGLPTLIEHNADSFRNRRVPLYLVTELIEGENLKNSIERLGLASDDNAVMDCMKELARVVHRCHQEGVIHRDIKPANIILRAGDVARPVLVDFGISFNDAADDDLTRMDEEIGNRFLRLPEHATGGRASASDVTQLAGIFLYMMTGGEPRVLRDESDLAPHQRPEPRGTLLQRLDRRQFMRVMSTLDKAFAVELAARYSTASDFISALEWAMRSDQTGDGDLEDRLAQMDEIVASRRLTALSERRLALQGLVTAIDRFASTFAEARGLWRAQTGNNVNVTAEEAWHETQLAVVIPGNHQIETWVVFRFEYRGPTDFVLYVNGEQAWRGASVDKALTDAVQLALAGQFLASQAEPDADASG
ncbi:MULTISPECIES: serine/threonine protein kinase [unclassified Mycolicibacterium]|uniref:serine/threonine protein kinase n=1 Tax=unclassified Mycolicibacterium TaxID=2636767 RepID=UPI002ED86EE9